VREVQEVDRGLGARTPADPDAQFAFVTDPDAVAAGMTPFDMRGAELSHHGQDCTFETILARYQLDDPVLDELAALVHEADLADDRFFAPAAPGLDLVTRGLSLVCDDDEALTAPAGTPERGPPPAYPVAPPTHRPARGLS